MNNEQVKAFRASFINRVTLIQGPPGPGKTLTAALIIGAFAELGKNILLTSGSNAAVDDVAKKLDIEVLRKVARYIADSAEEKVDPSVLARYEDRLFPKKAEKELEQQGYQNPSNTWNSRVKSECMKQLDEEYTIFFMTLHKVGDLTNQMLEQSKKGNYYKPLKPDVTVVEEAAQILEGHMCNALTPMPEHGRLIQIGDHMQLPATCRSIENKANSYDRSQFERLLKNGFLIIPCYMTNTVVYR